MAWARVQSVSGPGSGNVGTLTETLGSTPCAGNKVIVAVTSNTPADTMTVADANSVSLTQIGFATRANCMLGLFAYDVPVQQPAAFTASVGATNGKITVLVQEAFGLLHGNTTAMCDGTAGTGTGSQASPNTSPAYSSAALNEYLMAIFADWGNSIAVTIPTGYTADINNINSSGYADLLIAYRNSTGGVEPAVWTFASDVFALITVAFKLAPPVLATYDPYFSSHFTPTAWWKLNDAALSTTAADSSGNGHTATLTGGTGITFGNSAGMVSPGPAPTGDACLKATGNAAIGCLETSFIASGTTFSLVAWFASINNAAQNASGYILTSTAGNSTEGVALAVSTVSGVVTNVFVQMGQSGALCQYNVTLGSSWHMVVATYDATSLRLYIDGALGAGPTAATLVWNGSTTWTMLNTPGTVGGAGALACYLAEVAVLQGTVLTATQISNLYAAATAAYAPYSRPSFTPQARASHYHHKPWEQRDSGLLVRDDGLLRVS